MNMTLSWLFVLAFLIALYLANKLKGKESAETETVETTATEVV